jgi:hypothetical protein
VSRSLTLGPLIAACTIAAAAQSPPARPVLPATADTNDVEAYLAWGKSKLQKSPADAAAAFYWASRLDPARPGAYYARWVALQLTDKSRFAAHYERKKSTLQSPEVLVRALGRAAAHGQVALRRALRAQEVHAAVARGARDGFDPDAQHRMGAARVP